METLTDVALRVELGSSKMSEEALAGAWGIDIERPRRDWRTELTGEVRRRLLFDGDTETYLAAKKAADGWEHGFLGFDEVRDLAVRTSPKTARYVRDAFLRLANVEGGSSRTSTPIRSTRPSSSSHTPDTSRDGWSATHLIHQAPTCPIRSWIGATG